MHGQQNIKAGIVLTEVGALGLKHVGDTPLIFVYVKLTLYIWLGK